MKKLYYNTSKCLGCKSCEIACSLAHSKTQSLFAMLKEEVLPLPRKRVYRSGDMNFPISCRHCEDARCVDACMAGALRFDKEKGIIIHDESRCVGCWMCVMVCPYGAIRPNLKTKIPIRCDMCKEKEEPSCVIACPTKAIIWQ
jgi:carbon-monoxide dehydrogenase iron sulfur subunit